MNKLILSVSGLAIILLSACGPAYYWEDPGYTYDERWDVVTEVSYTPIVHPTSSTTQAHGTLLYRVESDRQSHSVDAWLNLPDGRISKASLEADPCYFASDMNHTFGTVTEIECVDPMIGPYALTLKNAHSFPVSVKIVIERNTDSRQRSTQSLYAQTFDIEPYKILEIPLLFESN